MKLNTLIKLLITALIIVSISILYFTKINPFEESFTSNIVAEVIGLAFALLITYLIIENIKKKRWQPIEKRLAIKVRVFIESFYSITFRMLPSDKTTAKVQEEAIHRKINHWEEAINNLSAKITKSFAEFALENKKELITNLEKLENQITDILQHSALKPKAEVITLILTIQEDITDLISTSKPIIILEENPSLIPELKDKFFREWNMELINRYQFLIKHVTELDNYLYKEYNIRAWHELRNK